jgi:hypothetical protein
MKTTVIQIGEIKQVTKLPAAHDLNSLTSIYACKAAFIGYWNRRFWGF